MDIVINLNDGVPIYRQISNQIRYMVASGLLESGEEIPSIRTLALRLKVTPNTVVKAYDELESTGVLEKRPGAGTFVRVGPTPMAKRERYRIIDQRIDAVLTEAHQLGIPEVELVDVFRRRLAAMNREAKDGASSEEGTRDRKLG